MFIDTLVTFEGRKQKEVAILHHSQENLRLSCRRRLLQIFIRIPLSRYSSRVYRETSLIFRWAIRVRSLKIEIASAIFSFKFKIPQLLVVRIYGAFIAFSKLKNFFNFLFCEYQALSISDLFAARVYLMKWKHFSMN